MKPTLENHCWACNSTTLWEYVGKQDVQGRVEDMYQCEVCDCYATRRVLHIMNRDGKKDDKRLSRTDD